VRAVLRIPRRMTRSRDVVFAQEEDRPVERGEGLQPGRFDAGERGQSLGGFADDLCRLSLNDDAGHVVGDVVVKVPCE